MLNIVLGLVVAVVGFPIICCTALELYDLIIDYR